MATARTISMSATFNAKPYEVFKALTDAREIRSWSGQSGRVEAKVGGKYEMFDGWARGKVLAFKTGTTLVHTWQTADGDAGMKDSIVKYSFTSTKSGTKVTLRHSGLPDEKSRKEHQGGWVEFVFEPLKQYFKPKA